MSIARIVRTECSECSSQDIRWMTAGQLLYAVGSDLVPRVREAVAFFGRTAEAWQCQKCPGFGVFGPDVWEGGAAGGPARTARQRRARGHRTSRRP